jgi:hypothetical protein
MPRPTFHVLVLLALWLLPACRTVPNAAYCETPTDCDDGWTCDTGRHVCIPPAGAGCSDSDACTRANEPICDLAADPPVCRGCSNNQQCIDKNPGAPFCSPDGTCMAMMPPECVSSENCTDTPLTPICDTSVGMCKGCDEVADQTACEMLDGGAVPYCDRDGDEDRDGTCAACLDSGQCNATTPVCDPAARTCSACKAHDDCAAYSGVCDGGACADESEVVYVAKTGADSGDCTKGAPCLSLPYARDKVQADNANKHFIRILDQDNYAGTAGGAFTLTNVDVTIIAVGATITSIDNNRPIIDVGANTDITLDGVIIRASGTGVEGARCQSNDSRVQVENVTVDGNQSIGINIGGGCEVVVERSIVSGNRGGGIKVSEAPFTITNSYIMDNGGGTSAFGGIQISNGLTADPQVLAFNTILNNNASTTADTRGVDCAFPGASPLRATSNILRGGSGGLALLERSNCDWIYSSIEALPADLMAAEKNNIDNDCTTAPGADELPRIDAASMCKERGEPNTGNDVDYDGDLRPDGAGADKPDMGADEIVE